MASPATILRARPASPASTARRAPSTEAMNGPGTSWRPSSRKRMTSSSRPRPRPPDSPRRASPEQPELGRRGPRLAGDRGRLGPPFPDPADRQLVGEKLRGEPREVELFLRGEKIHRCLRLPRETENPVADDVALDFRRASADGGREGVKVVA